MRVNSRYSPNSLTLEFIDLDKALSDLATHSRDRSMALWTMGDILERVFRMVHASEGVRREFAKQGVSQARFAEHLGVSPSRLAALRLTAASFQPKDRNYDLSWEHHHAIAKRFRHETAAVRRKWLREAAKNDWSVSELRARLRGRVPQAMVVEARIERLRRQLADAEARLALLHQDPGAGPS
jgi:transcriptional regulator with XRE-family HTH domain